MPGLHRRTYDVGKHQRIRNFDSSTHTSGNLAGFTAQWLVEGGSGTDQTPALKQLVLKANKLGIFTKASNELVADGMTFEQQLGRLSSVRLVGTWIMPHFAEPA